MTTGKQTRAVVLPLYWLVVGAVTCLLSPVAAVAVSVNVNNRTMAAAERQRTAAQQEADRQAEAIRREQRKVTCSLAASQLDAFAEAQSPPGKASYQAWLDLYRLAECQPIRKAGFTVAKHETEKKRKSPYLAVYTLPIRDNANQLDGWTLIPEANPVCRARVLPEFHTGSLIVYVNEDGSITLSSPDEIEVDYTLEG